MHVLFQINNFNLIILSIGIKRCRGEIEIFRVIHSVQIFSTLTKKKKKISTIYLSSVLRY